MAQYRIEDTIHSLILSPLHGGLALDIDGTKHAVSLTPLADGRAKLTLGSETVTVAVTEDGDDMLIKLDGEVIRIHRFTAFEAAGGGDANKDSVIAPMPGTVIAIETNPGAQVSKGDPLMIIESMKLQTTIAAPRDGEVEVVCFAAADTFDKGNELIKLVPLPTEDEETK